MTLKGGNKTTIHDLVSGLEKKLKLVLHETPESVRRVQQSGPIMAQLRW